MLPNREDYLRELGANIRASRRKKKVSQSSLAAALGLSRVTIAKAEKGKQNVPIYTLEEIATALGTSVTELLPAQGHEPPTWIPAENMHAALRTWITRIVERRDFDE